MEKKGHFPVKQLGGGRLSYLCPLPWHSESKPSFIVWTNADYENFYCFGCSGHHNIIHLVSFMEGITSRKAIELLADGMEFSIVDEGNEVIDQILQETDLNQRQEFSKALLEISSICNNYLESVDYDLTECERIDKVWMIIDNSLRDYDFSIIERIKVEIGGLLLHQKDVFLSKHIQSMHDKYGTHS